MKKVRYFPFKAIKNFIKKIKKEKEKRNMTNKEILLEALKYKTPKRVPWVPYVGVHAAYLIDKPADEYLKSAELIYQGVSKAIDEYNPDGVPIVFELQLEAEALGCKLLWHKDNPPSVTGHILDEVSIEDLKPLSENAARIPIVLEATEKLIKVYKNDIGLMGLVCGPFTLALHLMGIKVIKDMIRNPEEVFKVMNFAGSVCKDMARMYLERGVEIIAIVDPMTSQISPKFFDKFVAPYYEPAINIIKQKNAFSMLFVCGDATRVIPNYTILDVHGIGVDENVDFQYVADEARKQGKAFAGNLPLTVGLLFGSREDNIEYAQKCIEIGKGPGFILAPGCDMPYDTPPENVKAVVEVVYESR